MSSHSGTLYIGMTNDLEKRIRDHKLKLIEGFSSKYNCTRLVYYESFDDVRNARKATERLEKQQEKLHSSKASIPRGRI